MSEKKPGLGRVFSWLHPSHPRRRRYLLQLLAIELVTLLIASQIRVVGHYASGAWHEELHWLAFFLLSIPVQWLLGGQRWLLGLILCTLAAIGHEGLEVFGHSHIMEWYDVGYNMLGVLSGILLAWLGEFWLLKHGLPPTPKDYD
ncbi:hypothetical protein ACKC9G_12305 [Pokkaliibacter sp. CJK22405]|uniref:hypothetical protein n=1 Tax=Pokkaliibacter sp. CJK22405 TaxID=3384615 RepID=UPI00398482E5